MSTQQITNCVNGVDVDRLFATKDAIKQAPTLANFTFRVRNSWLGGGHNRSTVKDFYGAGAEDTSRTEPFVLDNGEVPVLLGSDEGPNPVEYVLHALAGCLTTSLVYHAAARSIQIDEVQSVLEGDLDLHGFLGLSDSVRNGYQNIRVTFRIEGDATDEQLEELGRLAQQRSPVFDILTNPVPVSVTVEK
jgi:uncharacterized OsmC-like protein